jgi:hypothetical protein
MSLNLDWATLWKGGREEEGRKKGNKVQMIE